MSISRLKLLGLLLIGCRPPGEKEARPGAPPAAPPAAETPDGHPGLGSDVQRFFDWYLVNTDETRTVEDVLRDRPQVLDPELRALLEADQKCAAASGEVCKLDFDPFVNAQDLCVLYRVRDPRQVATLVEFSVYAGCLDDVTDTTPRLTVVVQPLDSGWVFKDIKYPGGRSLVAMLREGPR